MVLFMAVHIVQTPCVVTFAALKLVALTPITCTYLPCVTSCVLNKKGLANVVRGASSRPLVGTVPGGMTRRTSRGDTDDTLPEQNITSGVVLGLTPYDDQRNPGLLISNKTT